MQSIICRLALMALLLQSPTLKANSFVSAVANVSHIMQNGTLMHETRVHVFKDGKFYVEEVEQAQGTARRLVCQQFRSVLTQETLQQLKNLLNSPEFQGTDQELVPLNHENSDVWYVVTHRPETQFSVFKTPDSRPPASFVVWFEGVRSLKTERIPSGQNCSFFSSRMADAWRR